MQQYYRIALGMCLLIGYLQAQPVKRDVTCDFDDLSFNLLDGVSCTNLTFTSPTAAEKPCYNSAKKLLEEWGNATKNCNVSDHIGQTLEALEWCTRELTQQCNFTTTVHTEFASFVNATKTFAERVNAL